MKKSQLILLLTLLLGFYADASAVDANNPELKVLAEFSFEPNELFISLPVQFKGKEHLFFLDTGVTYTVFDTSLKEHLGKLKGAARALTAGPSTTLEFFDAPEAFLGPLSIQDDTGVICADLKMLTLISGRHISGIIGMDFLKKYTVQIDFDNGRVLFISPNQTPQSDWGHKSQLYDHRYGVKLVKAGILGYNTSFMIDSGDNGTASLESSLFKLIVAKRRIKTAESLAATAGGIVKSRMARVDNLSIGSLDYEGIIIDESRLSALGFSFLSRHKVTLDFSNNAIYLKKGRNFNKLEEVDMSGLHLVRDVNETLVYSVDADSPAEKAGVQAEDIVIRINSKDASAHKIWHIRDLLKSGDGNIVKMTIKRGDQEKDVQLTLKKRI